MATLRDIKRRLRSTANMQQITRAMEAVSASKMRKSQMVALAARPYSVKALEMLGNLGETTKDHWLLAPYRDEVSGAGFREHQSDAIGLLVFTSDKGLCGGYNSAIFKRVESFIKSRFKNNTVELIVVGKKAITYFKKKGYEISAEFTDFGDYIEVEQTSPVARLISDRFKKGAYREVWAVYTNFLTTLKQETAARRILPIELSFIREIVEGIIPEYGRFAKERQKQLGGLRFEYILEPNPQEIFDTLLPALFEVAIHHIILESNASEHSARMVAMRNASENASEILETLNLSYNKLRQANITKELLEVIAGREALESA